MPLLAGPRQDVRHERRQVGAVRPHPAQSYVFGGARKIEQSLRRLVHQDDISLLVCHQDRVGHRVDNQLEPVPLSRTSACARRRVR